MWVHSSFWVVAIFRLFWKTTLHPHPRPSIQELYCFVFLRMGVFIFLGLRTPQEAPRGAISLCLAQMVSWASSEFLCESEALSKLWASGISVNPVLDPVLALPFGWPSCPVPDSCGTSQPCCSGTLRGQGRSWGLWVRAPAWQCVQIPSKPVKARCERAHVCDPG